MTREMTAAVLLKLKDQFSSQIKGAGISVQGFAGKAADAAEKVNKAFSGTAGILGGLGVSIGALGAIKSTIDLDNRMVRLGLTANASAAQVNALKRQIFETAQMPEIKLDTDSIISGLEVVMTKVGDLKFVEDNVRNIALAIQASGESGDAMGAVFSEFAKFGYTMEEILPLMDDLIAQGDQGAFTFGEFAKNAPAVFSAYSVIGTTPEHIRKANAAMQILMAGTKSADIAVTALNSTMAELGDSDKQRKLSKLGINVRDLATGEFRDFNDIMFDIVAKAEEMGNADFFGTIFGTVSMSAVRAYMTQGGRMYDGLVNLGDTAGLLQQKSAVMAGTLKSNFQNLQTAFLSFADKNLTEPLQNLADLMNVLAENPEKIEAGIKGITLALGGLAAVKLGAGIVSFVANLKGIQGGKNLAEGLTSAGGGAGIPVHVTNWGGSAGSSMPGPAGSAGIGPGAMTPTGVTGLDPKSNNAANFARGARTAGIITAATVGVTQAVSAYQQVKAIDADTEMSEREKSKAKGGAVGGAVGTTVGTGAGVIAGSLLAGKVGAMIGTAIAPGIGTAIGGAVGLAGGAVAGWLGGMLGKKAGEAVGDLTGAMAERKAEREALPRSPGIAQYNAGAGYPGITGNTATTNPVTVNDLIITPQGRFNTHPDDYILAMKNPAALVSNDMRGAIRSVERVPRAASPVVIEGMIELRSELVIDDKGYRLRQAAVKNTTPYKFAVGSAKNARLIQ
jgi:hypothetical protein